MTPPRLAQNPVVAFDRLDALADPAALSSILGELSSVEREPRALAPSGFSSSRHESLRVTRLDGSVVPLRIKRMHIGQDWLARRHREIPPGREVSLLSEPSLASVWDCFTRAHLAYAVEGSEVGLLMEDHARAFPPDVREPITPAMEEAFLHAIASLHARFWESPALGLPWLSRPEWYCEILGPRQAEDEASIQDAPQSIRDGVRNGWPEALALLPAEVAARLTEPADRLWLPWADLPKTLTHGDTKVANFAFLPEGRIAAFDWTNLGAAPATVDLGWYLAVNSTRLARPKEAFVALYRGLLERKLGRAIEERTWERMMDAAIVSGARMLLWSKALSLREGTAARRQDWEWWVAGLTRWCRR